MASKQKINNLIKRLERKRIQKSFKSIPILGDMRPNTEGKCYDYRTWEDTGKLVGINIEQPSDEYTKIIYVNVGGVYQDGVKCGFVPPITWVGSG